MKVYLDDEKTHVDPCPHNGHSVGWTVIVISEPSVAPNVIQERKKRKLPEHSNPERNAAKQQSLAVSHILNPTLL